MEHELKLTLPAAALPAALAFFEQISGRAGRAWPLVNRYFDTPSRALATARVALRLRETPDGWLQTLKAGGSVNNGLHSRHEWEMPVAAEALDLETLLTACDDASIGVLLRACHADLSVAFETNFTRILWDLDWQGASIEAAIDQGAASATVDGQKRSTPISEIELELKHGPATALESLAQALSAKVEGLRPDDISKAQRGYRLIEKTNR